MWQQETMGTGHNDFMRMNVNETLKASALAGPKKDPQGVNVVGTRKGVNKLNFQVKGQEYFLAFVEDERRWYLFAPREQEIERFPVYVDAAKYDNRFGISEKTSSNLSS